MRFLALFFVLVFSAATLFAQDSTIVLNDRTYIYEDNQWFIRGEFNGKSKLAPQSFTIKLKENIPAVAFQNFCNARGIQIVRSNELGYIDLRLPENACFHTSFNNFTNIGLFESVTINRYYNIQLVPNDPFTINQYYLYPWSGESWPHINARDAWDIETGATNPVIVAVIDVGVKINHADLIYNQLGWSFIDNNNDPSPLPNEHHGTSMAGIIGAKTNNDVDISGIAGGWWDEDPGSLIMAIRAGSGGQLRGDIIDDAIYFAAINGAKVINMSFGSEGPPDPHIDAAINYAYGKGCFMVAASGNETVKLNYPARHPLVLAVSGIKKDWTSYSTIWPGVDVTAPVQDIWSLLNFGSGNSGTGTSASCAMASGVAALLLSFNPNLTPMDIKNVITSSAVYEPQMVHDPLQFGSGLLKANRAVSCLLIANGIIPDYPTNLTVDYNPPLIPNPILTWRTVFPTLESGPVSHYNIYRSHESSRYNFNKVGDVQHDDGFRYHDWTDNSQLMGGIYYYRVTTVDYEGMESITSNEVFVNSGIEWKIGVNNTTIAFEYQLEQNYPNPFNPVTKINYTVKEAGITQLRIFDVLGREITTLVNEVKEPGTYEVVFNAADLASGIYIYKLQVNEYTSAKKNDTYALN